MITTIITTYQRPLLLKRAINSVLKQSHGQFQICVYDNASTDETEALMLEFIKKDKRIKYHRHKKNIGMMANYEFALSKINTPYFHLLSDDDYLFPDFYQTALKGFQDFPDAAFSACSVLQMNERGEFCADPFLFWKKDGYFASQQGLFEMLEKRGKFPVPTGILFQNEFVKNIKPLFNNDNQLHWDPDYLIQIAASYPIVISKKYCAAYLVHSNSFAYSIYANLLQNIHNVEIYLKSTHAVMNRIKTNKSLTFFNKIKTKRLFKQYVVQDLVSFVKTYISVSSYGGAHFSCKKFFKYFGFSFTVIFFHMLAAISKGYSVILNYFLRHEPQVLSPLDATELKKFHNYGQKLFNDH